jgi:predicted dehydrogenase
MTKKLRIGVVGLQWGLTLAQHCRTAGMDVVAVCEINREKLQRAVDALGATPYEDYDAFLTHDMDAVILANAFDEHAQMAIQALNQGKHVLSETAACKSMAEGVELIRTVERTGLVYMLAANYPLKPCVTEMRRMFQAGDLGVFQYGECEYLHSWSPQEFAYFIAMPNYWRARISALAYCTHSITPVMYVTDTVPTEVSAFVIPVENTPESLEEARQGRGLAGAMMIKMDNGTYLKSLHGFLQGDQHPDPFWIRIHGSQGLVENVRRGDARAFRLHKEKWATESKTVEDTVFDPDPSVNEDYLICESFGQAITNGERPYFDVYRSVIASIVAISALRSQLNGSIPVEIPDLRREEVRRKYEADHWNGLDAQ